MAALCSLSEHCESEIREKLRKAAMPASDIEDIVDKLYDEGFLDTARYCRAYARDKLRFDHWGSVKIQKGLRMKGLPDADIRKAIADLYEELGDEYSRILEDTLRQKARKLPSPTDEDGDKYDDNATDYIRRSKLIRFAASRGFTPDEILEAINALDA